MPLTSLVQIPRGQIKACLSVCLPQVGDYFLVTSVSYSYLEVTASFKGKGL